MTKKHLPTRTCIACRRIKPKQNMIRIVRNPDGIIELDESGKANGRGGYLCQHFLCWHRALKKRATLLKRILKVDLDRDTYMVLKEFAMQYKPPKQEKAKAEPDKDNQAEGENAAMSDTQAEGENAAMSDTQAENVSNADAQSDNTANKQATTAKENLAQRATEEKKEESS